MATLCGLGFFATRWLGFRTEHPYDLAWEVISVQPQRPSQVQEDGNKLHLLMEQWKCPGGARRTGNPAVLKTTFCYSGRDSEVESEAKNLPRISRDERQCWAQFFVCAFGWFFGGRGGTAVN